MCHPDNTIKSGLDFKEGQSILLKQRMEYCNQSDLVISDLRVTRLTLLKINMEAQIRLTLTQIMLIDAKIYYEDHSKGCFQLMQVVG